MSRTAEEARAHNNVRMREWRARNAQWLAEHRPAYNRAWYAKRKASDPDYVRRESKRVGANTLARKLRSYGITPERYASLVSLGCAICGGPSNGRGRYHLDHDHKTGAFRGLLCHSCNVSIGHFGDDAALLRKAVAYLDRHSMVSKID